MSIESLNWREKASLISLNVTDYTLMVGRVNGIVELWWEGVRGVAGNRDGDALPLLLQPTQDSPNSRPPHPLE